MADNNSAGLKSKMEVSEPGRKIPVRAETDVIVVGGGLAGVSAAVAAARAGARTMLIERNSFPGGVATAGMCCSVFNCFYTFGRELVVKGNPLEFVDKLSKADGPGLSWHKHKGHIIYDIEKGKLTLIELLEEAGVECLFETLTVGAVMEDDIIKGIIIESKSGREAVLAKVVVDATGDSDVAKYADVPLKQLEPGRNKSSYVFRVGNVDVDGFVQYFKDNPDQYPENMDIEWTLEEAVKQYEEEPCFSPMEEECSWIFLKRLLQVVNTRLRLGCMIPSMHCRCTQYVHSELFTSLLVMWMCMTWMWQK